MNQSIKFINLTPHALNIKLEDGNVLTIEPSGKVARVAAELEKVCVINGIKMTKAHLGEIVDLPDSKQGVIYIVSSIVREAIKNKGRDDIVSPGKLIRNNEGHPIGCDGLSF